MLHKAIKGYEDYLISDTGQVYSLKSGKYLKSRKSREYYQVNLYKDGKHKTFKVHRLVAQAFIPNLDNKPTVDHIDRDPSNNQVDNLRWATPKEQNYNRDLINFAIKCRKARGVKIIEVIDDKEIEYLSLHSVPNIGIKALQNHIYKGETDFYVKQRNGNVRHFIVPQQK